METYINSGILNRRRNSVCESALLNLSQNNKLKLGKQRRGSIAENLLNSIEMSSTTTTTTKVSSIRSSFDANSILFNNSTAYEDETGRCTPSATSSFSKSLFSPRFKSTGVLSFAKRMLKSALKKHSDEYQDPFVTVAKVRETLGLKSLNYPEDFYDNETLIGEGAFGKVYLIKRIKDNRRFAAKKIPIDCDGSDKNYKKFMKEAIIGTMLEDPRQRTTIDISIHNSYYILLMDYYPITLARLVHDGKATTRQLNHHYRDVVRAVYDLHANGIAHRDLKLENLCLDLNGGIKVIDFGNAVLFTPPFPATCADVSGTDQYMAPEVLSGYEYDAKASDIWSLGILYLAMVMFKLPWPLASPRHHNYVDFLRDRKRFLDRYTDWPESFLPKSYLLRMLEINPHFRITLSELLEANYFKEEHVNLY